MSKQNINATLNLIMLITGTTLLWIATDWKIAIGAALLAVFAREDIK